MTERVTGQVTASAADFYEEHFVPALFRERAGSLLDRAKINAGAPASRRGTAGRVPLRANNWRWRPPAGSSHYRSRR